jgi:hypothetical protein
MDSRLFLFSGTPYHSTIPLYAFLDGHLHGSSRFVHIVETEQRQGEIKE